MGGRGGLIRLRYVHAFTDRHGHQRHYFRRHGKRTVLPGLPGSAEFMAAYASALGRQAAEPPARVPVASGTFTALAREYFASANFKGLAPSSRANYRRVIESFLATHGTRRVDQMRRKHVVAIIGAMGDRPGAAIELLKRIRALVRFAIHLEWIAADPTLEVKSYQSQEFHTWTEAEIAQFERHWPMGTRERLAFDLLLFTGQRTCDVCRMARPDAGGKIRIAQKKTKKNTDDHLTIAVHPQLAASLAATPSGHIAAIVTSYGHLFGAKGFGHFMRVAIRAAGLPKPCVTHGLRKAAARRLAEAGCSAKEIMAVTGHRTLSEIERYVRAAEQEGLNQSAMTRQIEKGK